MHACIKSKTILGSSLCLFLSSMVYANEPEVVIVNHYDKPLDFIISVNQDVLPDLPMQFSLQPNEKVRTRLVDTQKQSYILAEDNSKNLGFWGVEVSEGMAKFHGYTSKGIAFSWNNDSIIFCTPEAYQEHSACM